MKKNGFTLIELIVGITISMLLMVSIGVFVSTGMSNITLQKKILDDNKKISSDIFYLQKNILNSKKYVGEYNSGILLRQNKYFDKGGFSYIGVKEFDGIYCSTGEITKTNHLFVENFIPLDGVQIDSGDYKTDIHKNQLIRKSDNSILVGKDIFGNKLVEGAEGTDVFLNSPTGLVEIDGKIVFSDTLNDRVLYLSGSQVYTLLDEKNGLNEPIGLAYNSGEKALYIANAGKGEILKLSSKKYLVNPDLEVKNVGENNISKLKIEILETTENLTDSTNLSDYSFSSSNDFVKLENNKINYYFINNYATESSQSDCNFSNIGDIIVNSNDDVIKCVSSGTGQLANYRTENINDFTIKNIKPVLVENKNYYIKLFGKYYPYFTQGDDDIFTRDDNILEIFNTGLFYPTGVDSTGNPTEFNPITFNYSALQKDFIFFNPIKKIEKNYSSNLLNIKLNYYKYLNCFNPDQKIERTFLIKKGD